MEYYRNLPHFNPTEAVFFITARLAGSLPVAVIEMLKEEKEIALKQIGKLEVDKHNYENQRRRILAFRKL